MNVYMYDIVLAIVYGLIHVRRCTRMSQVFRQMMLLIALYFGVRQSNPDGGNVVDVIRWPRTLDLLRFLHFPHSFRRCVLRGEVLVTPRTG